MQSFQAFLQDCQSHNVRTPKIYFHSQIITYPEAIFSIMAKVERVKKIHFQMWNFFAIWSVFFFSIRAAAMFIH